MKLKIKLVPYERFKTVKFDSLLTDLEKKTIILIDAKLTPEEEAALIENTMSSVSDSFSGIELSSLELGNNKKERVFEKIRNKFIGAILGKRMGVTIIGPAKIVRKIKKNPEELLLYI